VQQRIARAQELIETSDEPLSRIAERCGFGAPETFRLAFRRRVGLPPSRYRRRFRRAAL
jgi:AraC family transcriptional activator FtrA